MFTDQVVLITGAGRGLGRALARAFALRGAIIAANDLTPINLDTTIEEIEADGGRSKAYIFDIAKKMPIQAMLEHVRDDWGRLDILINNAAVNPQAGVLDMDEWDWRRTIDVNLTGSFLTIQSGGRIMKEQGGGTILNIGAHLEGNAALANRAAFAASKQGLLALTRVSAQELAPHRIRVNAISPGLVDNQPPVHTVTELALFLCGPHSAGVTGQIFTASLGLYDG